MVKINVLVLERPNIIRSRKDFTSEHLIMRKLFDKHEGGMMVRFDLTDSTISKYYENRILGSGIKEFHAKYAMNTFNYAAADNSYLNLLGVVGTTFVDTDSEKKSNELKKIVDTIETTAALFNYKDEADEAVVNTFDTIRKGFIEFDPNKNIARKQRDHIVIKGIPEMTIVLCTITERKEADLKSLREYICKYFMLPSINELNQVIKASSTLDHEIEALKKVSDGNFNSWCITMTESSEKRNKIINEFIEDMKKQNVSILQIMHTLNALGKSQIKESSDDAHKKLKDVKSLDDLVKLTCVI